ncbi:hypothetical protein D3874_07370 [Oleomonas cavernae]|uniref:Sulfotransferase domain-containing protein n=1 Tax=Oleomonas cavernae TaxID=2320859 RepID=A0A418W9Z1_9PROT|nr:sulfotransferase domain-containing protein [Oleomonas cavernae]RJF86857.1 hypothetical protein D3874_07370 [Oleomonas cavernae]
MGFVVASGGPMPLLAHNGLGIFSDMDLAAIPEYISGKFRARRIERAYWRQFVADRNAADTFLISFPKSGRTWHRVLLGHYLCQLCGVPEQQAFQLDELSRMAGTAGLVYSHNGANFTDGIAPSRKVVAAPASWQGRRVILLVREPRDTLVSAYHHARHRDKTFDGSLHDFIRDPCTGIDKLMTARCRWYDNRALAAEFHVLSYEEMHADPAGALRSTLQWMGVTEIIDEYILKSVDFCSFEKMKIYEITNYFDNWRLKRASGDPSGGKVREGKIGSSRRHFSDDDEAFVKERVLAYGGDPFAAYHLPPSATIPA